MLGGGHQMKSGLTTRSSARPRTERHGRAEPPLAWQASYVAEQWSKTASLYDGPRALGGLIQVANGRLRFKAHAFDKALGGREVDVALNEVERLTLTKRSLLAPRRHVLVETRDGVRARFLVNGAKDVLQGLARDVREAGSDVQIVGLD